jgi:3',5'-cyclic AMP phosphodiesterase CpdA
VAEPYRLLHASDFHLSKVPYSAGSRNPSWLSKFKRYKLIGHDDAVLRAFARFVYYYGLQRRLFDIALLTGDLATSGFRRDLQRALDFLTTTPSHPATPAWVDDNNEPTIAFFRPAAMPGNHDRYRRTPPLCHARRHAFR